MNDPPSKAEEISAIRRLALMLGPKSYLGPWLKASLPFLEDSIKSDLSPLSAEQLYQQSTADRNAALAVRQEAEKSARQILDSARQKADVLHQQATAEAERITSRAWQAIKLAVKQLET